MLEIHFPCLYPPTCSVVVDNIYFFHMCGVLQQGHPSHYNCEFAVMFPLSFSP